MDLHVASLDKCWKDQLLFFLHLLGLYFFFFLNLNCSYIGNLTLVCGPWRYLLIWCMLRRLQNFPASAYLWGHGHTSFCNFHIDGWWNRHRSLTWENGIVWKVWNAWHGLFHLAFPFCVKDIQAEGPYGLAYYTIYHLWNYGLTTHSRFIFFLLMYVQ